MYITKYGCVFLKLVYVAMNVIPILLGSLPLAHNAQHSLVIGRAGASPPSRTTGPRCLYLCIYPVSVYRVPHCKNVRIVSTFSWLPQLHLFRGFYNSPHNSVYNGSIS